MKTHDLFAQPSLLSVPLAGADYVEERDRTRILTQLERILVIVLNGEFWTIEKLVAALRKRFPGVRFPENSVQAQLRNLRKVGYTVERETIGRGLSQYRVTPPNNPGIGPKLLTEVIQ